MTVNAFVIPLLCVTLSVSSGQAIAADMPNAVGVIGATAPAAYEPPPSDWEFTITPYAWLAGISGDIAQFGAPPVQVDASFSNVIDFFDFGGMVAAEVRNGPFGVMADLTYVKLSGASATPRGVLATTAALTTSSLMFTAAGEYRLIEDDYGSLDVLAGLRTWSVDTELSFQGGALNGVSVSDGNTWVDPLLGVKGRLKLSDNFYLTGWLMAGGFGVSSDFMWDAMGAAGYQFNDTVSAVVGYRAVGVDYRNGAFVYDVVQQGPIIGLTVKF